MPINNDSTERELGRWYGEWPGRGAPPQTPGPGARAGDRGARGERYPNWFNSIFEFRQKMIQFNIQFNIISQKFNSKNYLIQKNLRKFNSKNYSIKKISKKFNSKNYSIQ